MIGDLGNKMQICTQRYGKRPYGVGLLVAGYDDLGPHIFQTCPSANYYGTYILMKYLKLSQFICQIHRFFQDLEVWISV